MNVTALREVKLLRELRSPYLVRLLDVLPQKRGINLVRSQPTARLVPRSRWLATVVPQLLKNYFLCSWP